MEYQTIIKTLRNTLMPASICLKDDDHKLKLVLMAHGFCSNRHEDGAFSLLARRLLDHGISSIRIDFPGCGDSDESYLFNTIDNDVDDLRTAYEYLAKDYEIVSLAIVGYSMGGKVAVHYLEKYPDAKGLLLFAPAITNGLDWHHSSIALGRSKEMERAYEIANAQGYFNYFNEFDGKYVPLSKAFLEQCLNYKTFDIFNEISIPAMMIYGDEDDIIPLEIYDEMILKAANPQFSHHLIKGADHGFGMWNNKKELFRELQDTAYGFLIEQLD